MAIQRALRRSLIGALLLTAAVGCATRELSRYTIYPVTVGPSENQVKPDPQPISKQSGDWVVWTLIDKTGQPDRTRKLYIEFDRPDAFSAVTLNPATRHFRVQCNGGVCQSGAISTYAVPGISYKYSQIVVDPDGTEHPADGHIIINK